MTSELLIAGQKQRSCEVGQFAPKFITTCDYCGAFVWYEKGKKFFDCPNPQCGKTNEREGK